MNANIENHTGLENFIVREDGEVIQTPKDLKPGLIQGIGHSLVLQGRMLAYDLVYGTEYRKIHNELARARRNQLFEHSIGLIATK